MTLNPSDTNRKTIFTAQSHSKISLQTPIISQFKQPLTVNYNFIHFLTRNNTVLFHGVDVSLDILDDLYGV